jgi:hypothetical protein
MSCAVGRRSAGRRRARGGAVGELEAGPSVRSSTGDARSIKAGLSNGAAPRSAGRGEPIVDHPAAQIRSSRSDPPPPSVAVTWRGSGRAGQRPPTRCWVPVCYSEQHRQRVRQRHRRTHSRTHPRTHSRTHPRTHSRGARRSRADGGRFLRRSVRVASQTTEDGPSAGGGGRRRPLPPSERPCGEPNGGGGPQSAVGRLGGAKEGLSRPAGSAARRAQLLGGLSRRT